jgi:hypothetical protein
MSTFHVFGFLSLAFAGLMRASGCGQNQSAEQTSQTSSAPDRTSASESASHESATNTQNLNATRGGDEQSIRLSDVVSSWESGAKDNAVRQLLAIRWDEAEILGGVPVLNISEKGFMALARDERTQMQTEAIEFTTTAKGLARHAISLGEQAHAAGDQQRNSISRRSGSLAMRSTRKNTC